MTTLQKIEKIVKVGFVRKPFNLEEVTAVLKERNTELAPSKVIETWDMSAEEYDLFVSDFFTRHPRLKGKGGRIGDLFEVIEINAPERKTLYVNPEGADYARYVGFETI